MDKSLDVGKEVEYVLIFENIAMAFGSIMANKMRSILTMLGIIIGIGSVIAIRTVGASLTSSVTSMMEDMGASNITVGVTQKSTESNTSESGFTFSGPKWSKEPTKDDYITDEMLDELLKEFTDDIQYLSLSANLGTGNISKGRNEVNVNIIGGNAGFFNSLDLDMLAGDEFGDKALDGGKGVAIVSDYLVEKLYDGDNDLALGQKIEVVVGQKFYDFTIVGVYKYSNDGVLMSGDYDPVTGLYIPLKCAQNKQHVYGYSQLTVVRNTESEKETNYLMDEIETFFDRYYHSNKDFEVTTSSMESLLDMMTDMMGTVSTAISIVAGISLIVGGIGVMNIMLVSISERTREIGTRKALGATNNSIRMQFIVEAMMLCLMGGAIGIIIGVAGGSFAAVKLGYEASASASSIISSVLFSLAIGVFFGYYPANKAAKMNPIDALRYE